MKPATLSVDVDSVAAHLVRYGVTDCTDTQSAYELAIPRALELLRQHGVRATFFLVAGEAQHAPRAVRSIVEAGHEVACHTMTHDVGIDFSNLAEVHRELVDSKAILEELTGGIPVNGFRAPGWCYSEELLASLAAAGYRYDASLFPSWMLLASLLELRRRGVSAEANAGFAPWRYAFARGAPFSPADWPICEIPLSTVPVIRFPYYHTMQFMLPGWAMITVRELTIRLRSSINYTLHAVDFLGLTEDGLDPRIAVHPGLSFTLEQKLQLVSNELRALSARCEWFTMAEVAARVGNRSNGRVRFGAPIVEDAVQGRTLS